MSEVVYEVLTEFVFDVRGAINNSAALKGAVDNISSAADGAFLSLHKLADFASHGLGLNLSVMGVIGGAFASFDHFRKTQISFANIIASNMAHLTGNVETFNDKLDVSKSIMKEVSKISREYSLDEGAMMQTTKTLAAFLTPAGLSGKNMGNAVNMARMFEKSAPMLGIDTNLAQGELIRSISGQASMGDTLFRRLATEAPEVMGKYGGQQNGMMHHQGGGGAQMFNMLPMAKRFDLLNRAMAKFSNNAEVNAANAELLSNKLRVLKNEFIGFDGVLIPIGEVLSKNVKPVLNQLIKFIDTVGRPALVRFSEALQKAFDNPEHVYAMVRQLQSARANFAEAVKLTHIFGEVLFGIWIIRLPLVRSVLGALATTLLGVTGIGAKAVAALAGFAELSTGMALFKGSMMVFGFLARGLLFIFMRFIAPLAIIFGFLQLLSRAKAYAEAADVKVLINEKEKLGGTALKLSKNLYKMIAPLEMLWDRMARGLAPLFQYSTYLRFLANHMDSVVFVTDKLGLGILQVVGSILGLTAVFRRVFGTDIWVAIRDSLRDIGQIFFEWSLQLAQRLKEIFGAVLSGDFAGARKLASAPMNFTPLQPSNVTPLAGLRDLYQGTKYGFIEDFQKRMNDPDNKDKSVTNHTTNIGNVNIRQDFKENMEPDRIAHSFVKILKSVAINPTQASGRSFSGALTR